MAEKRKKRASKRVKFATDVSDMPAPKIIFGAKESIQLDESDSNTTASEKVPSNDDTESPKAQAKKMVDAQMESVNILKLFKKRVDSLQSNEVENALGKKGFFVVDDFLQDENVLDLLQQEGTKLIQDGHMEADALNLGSGEYFTTLQGGTDQYSLCPRSIELVVSLTKNLPEKLSESKLDNSACSSFMRTFDRDALLASISLLTGDHAGTTNNLKSRPFGIVAPDENDQRKISLLYYLVPQKWDDDCGGGLTFPIKEDGANDSTISAKRDRLVLWNSHTTTFKNEVWKGKDGLNYGSSVEMHLVKSMK